MEINPTISYCHGVKAVQQVIMEMIPGEYRRIEPYGWLMYAPTKAGRSPYRIESYRDMEGVFGEDPDENEEIASEFEEICFQIGNPAWCAG